MQTYNKCIRGVFFRRKGGGVVGGKEGGYVEVNSEQVSLESLKERGE